MAFLSILGIIIAALGAAGAYLYVFSPLFGAELILGGLGLVALAGILRIFASLIFKNRAASWFPIPLALLSGLGIGYFFFLANQHPITDLTTDPKNPPQYLQPVAKIQVGAGVENLDSSFYLQRPYKAELAAIQAARYPGIVSIKFKFPLEEAFAIIEKTIRERYPDWKITLKDPRAYRVEAEVRSTPFHFVDDVVIELRAGAETHSLDFRSRSRLEKIDLGMNAKRLYEMNSVLTFAVNKRQEEWDRVQKAATPVISINSATNPNQTIAPPVIAAPVPSTPVKSLPTQAKTPPKAAPAPATKSK